MGQSLSKIASTLAVTLCASLASPALANSSANNAADVTAPIEEAQEESLAKGDAKFRELFASWSSLDTAGPDPFAADVKPSAPIAVSVPSRNPLNAGYISSGYGMRVHPVLGRRSRHKGIDLAAPTGTPVYATADGSITRSDRSRSYGLVIYIDHGAKLETRYAHLSKLLVAEGEAVRKGDLIGYVGSTGRSTGPHLHYEVRVDGVAVNPIPYMKENETRAALAKDEAIGGDGRKRPGAFESAFPGKGGQ